MAGKRIHSVKRKCSVSYLPRTAVGCGSFGVLLNDCPKLVWFAGGLEFVSIESPQRPKFSFHALVPAGGRIHEVIFGFLRAGVWVWFVTRWQEMGIVALPVKEDALVGGNPGQRIEVFGWRQIYGVKAFSLEMMRTTPLGSLQLFLPKVLATTSHSSAEHRTGSAKIPLAMSSFFPSGEIAQRPSSFVDAH